MVDQPQDTDVQAFKDRKLGLVFFGVIQIAQGALFALLVLFGLVAPMAFTPTGQTGVPPAGPVLSSLTIFAPLAVAFVWLGIGSILARRWARALSLITAWL